MKINKYSKELLESKLVEDSEPGIDATGSVDEIADEIVDEIETASGGEETMSDEKAAKIAAEVKAVADDTGIDTAAIDMPDVGPLGVENDITRVLDMSLAKAKKNKKRGTKSGYNVLVIGLPGSGKTASIMDWAASKGVNLVAVNAKNNDLEAYINGYTTKRPDDPLKVTQAFSDNLAALEEPNSVLFLDEYNRQVKPHIRASLYTLINEHKIVGDGPNRQHEFKNLLFTIAAINPAVPTDKGAANLNDAEKSRFWWTLRDMDSDAATTIEYLTKYYNKLINGLDNTAEDYRENLEDYLRIQDLGIFIVSHPKFGYDTKADLDDLADDQKTLLCQRALTTGLHNADGDVDEFKFWVEKGSEFLPRDIDMLLAILKSYVKPTFEKLCAERGIDPAAAKVTTASAETSSTKEPEVVSDVEDDADFFTSSKGAGSARVKNPYEVEIAIANAIKDW
jgi:hypothetical protein